MKKILLILLITILGTAAYGQTVLKRGVIIGNNKTGTDIITVDSLIQTGSVFKIYKGATEVLPLDTATMLSNYQDASDVAATLASYAPLASPSFTGTVTTAALSIGGTSLAIDSATLVSGKLAFFDGADTLGLHINTNDIVDLSDYAVMLTDSLTGYVTPSQLSDSLDAFSGGLTSGEVATQINDTIVARLSAAVTGIRLVDSTGNAAGNYMPRLQTSNLVNDTITARIAAATVGVAAADSNIYAGYTTRTYVESLLGSGSGLSAKRLPFIIGTTTGAPTAADTIVVHSEFEGKHIDLYRDGAKQYQNFTATNTVEGFRLEEDTIYVYPPWQTGEQIMVDIIEPILWSYLSLEGQESSLLDSLRGYWKLDETSGTIVTDAAGIQNGTRSATIDVGVAGILGYANKFDASEIITIPYNADVSPVGVDFSVSIWFKLDSVPSATGHDMHLFRQGNNAAPWVSHSIYIESDDDKIFVSSRNTSETEFTVVSSGALSDSTWYNLVFVNAGNGQALKVYLNGSDVSASAGTFTGTLYHGLGTTNFGNSYSGAVNENLIGTLDSFGIWGKALTSGEVTSLYNSGNGRTHPFN